MAYYVRPWSTSRVRGQMQSTTRSISTKLAYDTSSACQKDDRAAERHSTYEYNTASRHTWLIINSVYALGLFDQTSLLSQLASMLLVVAIRVKGCSSKPSRRNVHSYLCKQILTLLHRERVAASDHHASGLSKVDNFEEFRAYLVRYGRARFVSRHCGSAEARV